MENEKDNVQEENVKDKKFLKIIKIRTFSNGHRLKLKEEDIILMLDGDLFYSTYEDLRKVLEEDDQKIITILRDGFYQKLKKRNAFQ